MEESTSITRSTTYKIFEETIENFITMATDSIHFIEQNMNKIKVKSTHQSEIKLKENQTIIKKILNPLVFEFEKFVNFFKKKSLELFSKTPEDFSTVNELIQKMESDIRSASKKIKIDIEKIKEKSEKVIYTKKNYVSYVYIGEGETQQNGNLVKQGIGSLTNGAELYKGEFVNDMKHGFGIQVFEDGMSFKGEWRVDLPKVGVWKDDNMLFYGYVNSLENWRLGEDLDFGVERKPINNPENGFTLYYKGVSTGLENLKIEQKIDIKALQGRYEEDRAVTRVEFMNEISYEGYWKNFKPHLLGKIEIPGNLGKEKHDSSQNFERIFFNGIEPDTETFQIIAYEGDFLMVEDFKILEEHEFYNCKKVEIIYSDGSFYKGYVDSEFRFVGHSKLLVKDPGSGSSKEYNGVYSSLDGLIFPLEQEDLPLGYLMDSEIYFKHSEELEVKEVKLWENTLFTGYWTEFWPDFKNLFRLTLDGAKYTNMAEFDDRKRKFQITGLAEPPKEKIFMFQNGDRYEGDTKFTDKSHIFYGYGTYTVDNKVRRHGFWHKGTLLIDFSLLKNTPEYWLVRTWNLAEGHEEVSFVNGLEIQGYWIDFALQNGVISFKNKKTKIRSREEYLKHMKERFSFFCYKAPYEFISLNDREMEKYVKERAKKDVSVEFLEIRDEMTFSQYGVLERLRKVNIVKNSDIFENQGRIIFNTAPVSDKFQKEKENKLVLRNMSGLLYDFLKMKFKPLNQFELNKKDEKYTNRM